MDTAKLLKKNVAVCQLPPRTHTPRAAEITDSFNGLLPTELECDIISTRESFYLADGTPNDGYLDKDQVHLNLRGSTKLVKCMGLAARDPNNPVLVNKKAAYNGDTQQEPSARKGQNKQSQPRASYAQAAKKKTTGPNDRQEMRTKPRTENTTHEMDPPAMTRNLQANKDIKENPSPIIRPPPLQPEYDFCGYCGEPGHRHLTCRHGGPVQCSDCGMKTHKKKFCHYYNNNY